MHHKLTIFISALLLTLPGAVHAKPKRAKKKPKPKPEENSTIATQTIHPFFALENLDILGGSQLKVGGMCFHKNSLYIVALSPDRTNRKPDRNGKLLRVDNISAAGSDPKGAKINITELCNGLYEPCAVGIVGDSIYVGEKHRIIRFNNGSNLDKLDPKKAITIIDGTSTENFHTYTIGFEPYEKNGKKFLCGNFSTAIVLGGKRDKMIPPNEKVNRGSIFYFGPLTGSETPSKVDLHYLAGGFRTPNGVEIGPDNTAYVADNQGVFNPSNELHRIKPGSFYGHYLHTQNSRGAAFQPEQVNSEEGDPDFQKAPTVHLPQYALARSPSQPHVIRDRKGILAPYNGQILLCEFTMGKILRISLEEVDGTWQGVAFNHSGGTANKLGNDGFTGGPNRLEVGPDGNYYIGQIGAGGLWEYNKRSHGLQRLRVKNISEIPKNFNEILDVKTIDGGFSIEFLKPISKDSIKLDDIKVSQWTYQSTSKYGGTPEGKVGLKPAKMSFSESGKKLNIIINGLKDASPKYDIKSANKSSANNGWVVHVELEPKVDGKPLLRTKQFWYTLIKKKGGVEASAGEQQEISEEEKTKLSFLNQCAACHLQNDAGLAAPNLKNILGRKQKVIKNGKEIEVIVDRSYLINAIINPDSEKTLKFKDVVMPSLGIQKPDAEKLVDYILKL